MRESVCPPRRMRFSFESRCRIVQLVLEGVSPQAAAAACGASRATGYRLWRRYQEGGWAGLRRPAACAEAAAAEAVCAGGGRDPGGAGVRQRRAGDRRRLARAAGLDRLEGASSSWPLATCREQPKEPVQRYERSRPGELIHVDIKKLGRFWTVGKAILGDRLTRSEGAGWQYLHLAIDDDHSRLAYGELLPTESPTDCVGFLRRAHAWYADHGVSDRTRPQR